MENTLPKNRKINSPTTATESCWICGQWGHFKDECLSVRCRFCKMLGHVIAECSTLPEKLREEPNESKVLAKI